MGCASSSMAAPEKGRSRSSDRHGQRRHGRSSSSGRREGSRKDGSRTPSPTKQPGRKDSPPKRSSSGKDKSLQRLLSANHGTVFKLGPEAQKGVETRLRRLSAPVIPAALQQEGREQVNNVAPALDDEDLLSKDQLLKKQLAEQQEQEQQAKKQQIAAAGKAGDAPAQQSGEPAAADVKAAAGAAATAAVAAVPAPAMAAVTEAQEEGEEGDEAPSSPGGNKPVVDGTTRARRMSVLGAPPMDDDTASSTESANGGATDTPLLLSPKFRSIYSDSRSRSAAWRQLQDFNLMEHCIHSVASLSRAGREPSYRKTNQDNCFAYQQFLHPSQALFGAMDGHGPNGHKVSSFVKKQFPVILAKQQESEDDNAQALVKAFVATQTALAESSVDCEYSGTTAVICFMHGRHLYTAWVGDSRAVLARQEHRGLRGIPLTRDHKPASHVEKMRIQAAGGRVERLLDSSGKPIGPHRVWLQHSWVPGLAMSRALGDAVAHTAGVTAVPDTDMTTITPQDRFLILASDGVWEFINSQTAVEIIAGCTSAEQACRLLVDAAHERWVEEEESVVDDITVVVVKFK